MSSRGMLGILSTCILRGFMGGCDFSFVPLETSSISVIRNRTKSPQTRRLQRVASRSNSLGSFPNVTNTTPHLAITNDRPSLDIFIRRLSRMQIHHHLFSVRSDVEERVRTHSQQLDWRGGEQTSPTHVHIGRL